jgi:chromosome segregation protein
LLEAAEADTSAIESELKALAEMRSVAEAVLQRSRDSLESARLRLEEQPVTVNYLASASVADEKSSQARIPDWLAAQPQSQQATCEADVLWERIEQLRSDICTLGDVNPEVEAEYERTKERHDFLATQLGDLESGNASIRYAIEKMEGILEDRFESTLRDVDAEFRRCFTMFFGGGYARLMPTSADEGGLPGVNVLVQPPGKRSENLNSLSSGEKALTAIALLFALLQTRPSPFCILDEVDTALDEVNVGRFVRALQGLSKRTQFIVITHNRRTMEAADRIYGVSMSSDGASRILSLELASATAS